ncbi:MAG TPA: Mur ligase family protein, partial [Anaeromyxobacter sp.]|nr:Mur ligase family protein [Anaeromyxobacter sp.]
MKLSTVIAATGARGDLADDPEITRITGDSRQVVPGACFFALPGAKRDGHEFAAAAAKQGAAAVVAERAVECAPARLLLAPSARRAMAIAAANFHGRPADGLALAGVTGTNGKTTITYLVEACAREVDLPIGVLGTVTHRFAGQERTANHTTPESTEIQALLAEMCRAGTKAVVMEVSS